MKTSNNQVFEVRSNKRFNSFKNVRATRESAECFQFSEEDVDESDSNGRSDEDEELEEKSGIDLEKEEKLKEKLENLYLIDQNDIRMQESLKDVKQEVFESMDTEEITLNNKDFNKNNAKHRVCTFNDIKEEDNINSKISIKDENNEKKELSFPENKPSKFGLIMTQNNISSIDSRVLNYYNPSQVISPASVSENNGKILGRSVTFNPNTSLLLKRKNLLVRTISKNRKLEFNDNCVKRPESILRESSLKRIETNRVSNRSIEEEHNKNLEELKVNKSSLMFFYEFEAGCNYLDYFTHNNLEKVLFKLKSNCNSIKKRKRKSSIMKIRAKPINF